MVCGLRRRDFIGTPIPTAPFSRSVGSVSPHTTVLQKCEQVNTLVPMYTVKRLPEFTKWLGDIKDAVTRVRLNKRLDKAQRGLLGDTKPVGEGVFEFREDFGPGWRMYYVQRGGVFIVMLGGGDKASQQADIEAAIALAKTLEE